MVSILSDSNHPKAQQLIDRLLSTAHQGETFANAYTSVGLKALDILDIFSNVQQARVFIHAMSEGDKVMSSLIRAAKDKVEVHDKCKGTGWVIDRKTGETTNEKCVKCSNTGYILIDGARDAQDLYFTLIRWKQQGGLINIDARKQQANFFGGSGPGTAALVPGLVPGEAPEITSIIKRADQQLIQLPAHAASTEANSMANSMMRMPEEMDDGETDRRPVEAEIVVGR